MQAWIRMSAALGMVCFSVAVAAELKGEVLEYGVYTVAREQARIRNLSTPTGYVRSGGKTVLANQTEQIPLKKGQLFGFRFRISGFDQNQPEVYLRLDVDHPEMTRPNGSKAKGYSYTVPLTAEKGVVENHTGYSLDNDYELIPGPWVFRYWLDDKILVEKSFTTVAE